MRSRNKGLLVALGILAAVLIAGCGWLHARGFGTLLGIFRLTRDWAAAEQADFQVAVHTEDFSLTGDGWWMQQDDGPVVGLQTEEIGVYVRGGTLVLDNGRAYALPPLPVTAEDVRELALAALLEGEITTQNSTRYLSLPEQGLSLTVTAREDRLDRLEVQLAPEMDGKPVPVTLVLTAKEAQPHAVPAGILAALSESDPPALTEVLEPLLPAAAELARKDTLAGDLTVTVDCGILTVDETFRAEYDPTAGRLLLETGYASIPVTLPRTEVPLSPAVLPVLLLRNGDMIRTAEGAQWRIALEPELTKALCVALIPEMAELDLEFSAMEARILVAGGAFSAASLHAGGEIPFLMTKIPISLTVDWIFD